MTRKRRKRREKRGERERETKKRSARFVLPRFFAEEPIVEQKKEKKKNGDGDKQRKKTLSFSPSFLAHSRQALCTVGLADLNDDRTRAQRREKRSQKSKARRAREKEKQQRQHRRRRCLFFSMRLLHQNSTFSVLVQKKKLLPSASSSFSYTGGPPLELSTTQRPIPEATLRRSSWSNESSIVSFFFRFFLSSVVVAVVVENENENENEKEKKSVKKRKR